MKKLASALVLLSTVLGAQTTPPPAGPERPLVLPARRERTLPNGLRVIVAERHVSPRISVALTFRSGQAFDPPGLEGLADFTGELMRRGTATRTAKQIAEELDALGAELSVLTDVDQVSFRGIALAENAEAYLKLLGEIAQEPSFPASEIEIHRDNSIQSLLQQRASPEFLGNRQFQRAIFGNHPYARTVPSEASLKAITRLKISEFRTRHFVPANAFLLIIGDVQPEAAFRMAADAFGGWRGGPAPRSSWPAPPSPRGRKIFFVHRPESVQSSISLGNVSIKRTDPDYFPVAIANTLFGASFASRLTMNIRESKGYTYSPFSELAPYAASGYFRVVADVRNEVTGPTLAEIFYELDRLRTLPVPEDELRGAQNYYKGVFSYRLASLGGLTAQFNNVYLYNLPADYLEKLRDNAGAVKPADVMRAARRRFDSANASIVVVGDLDKVGDQVELFAPVQAYDVEGKPKPARTVVKSRPAAK